MQVFLPTQEEFEAIKKKLEEVWNYMESLAKPEDRIFDNQQFLELMNVSAKTAATWRNEGKIGFSQEGKKIYYRMADIEAFLELCHKKPFAPDRKSF